MAKSVKTVKVTRSAKSGQFVPKKQAITKPSTTVTQTIRRTTKKRG